MTVEIDRALLDRRMLGGGFDDLSTWRTWLVILKAAFGLPLDKRERETFATVAGNRAPPTQRVRETWCVAGRRSGKSRMAAAIAIYLALFQKVSTVGRRARHGAGRCRHCRSGQCRVWLCSRFPRGVTVRWPKEIANIKRYEIELKNGIVIAVHSNSFRTVRGRTLVACVFDEVSFLEGRDQRHA